MEFLEQASVVVVMALSIALLAFLDKRFDLGLAMSSSDSWSMGFNSESSDKKDKEIAELKQRIEVLEKIATDPAEQLDREIRNL